MAEDKKACKLRSKVQRYIELIQDSEPGHLEHAIDRLEQVDMTVDCLQHTGVGRVLNQLRHHEQFGPRAAALVDRWRAMASEAARLLRQMSPTVIEAEKRKREERKRAAKRARDPFEAQLLAADDNKEDRKKKRNRAASSSEEMAKKRARVQVPDDDDIVSAVVSTTGPIIAPSTSRVPQLKLSTKTKPEEILNEYDPTCFKRKGRTKVYAGRPRNQPAAGPMPTLLQLCQRFLADHVDDVEELGDIPYRLIQPVLDQCTVEQLARITEKNPQLKEDLDAAWERHVAKIFRNHPPVAKRGWFDEYKRLCRERDERLHRISKQISERHATQAQQTQRQTALVDVINPAFARKRQIRSGIAPANAVGIPHALDVARARRAVSTGDKAGLNRLPSAVKGGKVVVQSRTAKPTGPKTGALMAKTLKMLKGRR